MIQDLSGSCCIEGTSESMTRVDSLVPLVHHDPDGCWITAPDPDHPKRMHPKSLISVTKKLNVCTSGSFLLS